MRGMFLRTATALAPVLLIVACGKAEQPAEESASTTDMAAPDVTGSSATRGVAFVFNYTFALPARAIAKVQRQHVTECERLGATRCRVTGITFDQQHGKSASGSLNLLLAPGDAYTYAGRAADIVEAAKGEIDTAMVDGRDAAGAIDQARNSQADARAEIARIDARLRAKNLSESERSTLTTRLEELHRAAGEQVSVQRESESALATTPVSFHYVEHGALGGDNRFIRAAGQSWGGVQDALILGMILLGYLLPWAVLIGAGVFIVRWLQRRRSPKGE
ncbi:hypothetical protein HNO88_000042 [Novosphingobium chloroacetimidivorans]|uniref:DUF4349 domain-containing protein n=1 Tax=Novosphingobium chloroacetimidivorans TaxID=1428314 RepID=A0A7W7NV35_9SPHN|nr:hypothetical protein [Novosphingobium chloroacetimidivorans]MBB4856745.1 hypothetical protein [Novosphingobium chloroacetimidivorans]